MWRSFWNLNSAYMHKTLCSAYVRMINFLERDKTADALLKLQLKFGFRKRIKL